MIKNKDYIKKYIISDEQYKYYYKKRLIQNIDNNVECLSSLLLDSSLILTTNSKKLYNTKIVSCGDYIQVYKIRNKKHIDNKNIECLDNIRKINNNTNNNSANDIKDKRIENKNILRSKFECQRLAKTNSNCWLTFITLTFEENITNIELANKKFRYFIDKIQRIKKDFKYICIPEFQKRGAVHYHLLTNISINDNKLIYSQIDNEKYKHIKYWNEGFTKVDILENDIKKIVGYISKYMTKDIDNRLFNRHRYYFSRNLKRPNIVYLDLDNYDDKNKFLNYINKKSIIYNNTYINNYNNDEIDFYEFL